MEAADMGDIGVIFAVRLLLRLVTLAPIDIDLREVGCKIDQFVTVLQQGEFTSYSAHGKLILIVPGQLSVERIRRTLLRARRARVLPPRSGVSTPLDNTDVTGGVDPSAALTSTLGLAWYPDLLAEPGSLPLNMSVSQSYAPTRPKADSDKGPSDTANGFDDDLTDLWQIFGS